MRPRKISRQGFHYLMSTKKARCAKCRTNNSVDREVIVLKEIKPGRVIIKKQTKRIYVARKVNRKEVNKKIYDIIEIVMRKSGRPLISIIKELGFVVVEKVGNNRESKNGYSNFGHAMTQNEINKI